MTGDSEFTASLGMPDDAIETNNPARVQLSLETALLLDRVYLPRNPRKLRAAPEVIAAVNRFKTALARAAKAAKR